MVERLNAKFIADYQALIDECNKWVCPVTEGPGGIWTFPIPNGGMTFANAGAGAFTLNEAGAATIGSFNTLENDYLTVQRFTLNYQQAQAYLDGNFSLLSYIKTALDSIHRTKGFSHNQLSYGHFYLTFNRPGHQGLIFREMENAAAFEFRACSDAIRLGMNIGVNNG